MFSLHKCFLSSHFLTYIFSSPSSSSPYTCSPLTSLFISPVLPCLLILTRSPLTSLFISPVLPYLPTLTSLLSSPHFHLHFFLIFLPYTCSPIISLSIQTFFSSPFSNSSLYLTISPFLIIPRFLSSSSPFHSLPVTAVWQNEWETVNLGSLFTPRCAVCKKGTQFHVSLERFV